MACGVPVVSTDTGGLPEVNIHGVSGLLSPVGDTGAMAANAFADPEGRSHAATVPRRRTGTGEAVRPAPYLPRYEALYEEVVAEVKA